MGPWWFKELDLRNLAMVLVKDTLPLDYILPGGLTDGTKGEKVYVRETYLWAQRDFDPRNKVHRLALLFGVIVAFAAPNVGIVTEVAKELLSTEKGKTDEGTFQILREMEWTLPPGSKAGASGGTFFAPAMTALMAMYDPQSPLQAHIAKSGDLGQPWTSKQGEWIGEGGAHSLIDALPCTQVPRD